MDATRANNERSSGEGAGPTIAVVICTRDRPEALARTLDTIWRQTRRPDEVIVVDDGRLAPQLRDGFAQRAALLGIRWLYLPKDNPGLTASRNLAARRSSSDVLQFLDDDASADPGLLAEIARLMSDPQVAGVAATVLEPTWCDPGSRVCQFGYRLAGWWCIRPSGRPGGPPPAALRRDRVHVARARFLSGAAMALRTAVVRANPFDESLGGYGLGEDREMAYRLAPRYWLLQSRRARVVHRRDPAPRGDPRRFGFMTAYNYLYILRRTCTLRGTHALVLFWTFTVLAAMHTAFGLVGGSRARFGELRGLVEGIVAALRTWPERAVAAPTPGFAAPPQRPLRVAFVTNRLEHGGAEWMLLSLARRLPACGVEPAVICLKDAGPLAGECQEHGIPVYEHLLRHKSEFAAARRIARLIRRAAIDVIVPVGSGGDRMFWATLAARAADVPIVVWSHWCPTPREQRFERANRALYRTVDRFVALGRRHRAALAALEYVPRGRIDVIRNGIDLPRFDKRHRRAEARALLGLAAHEIGIAIIANLRTEKRHDVFLAAAVRVAARHAHARFFIIGDGPNRGVVQSAIQRVPALLQSLRMLGARGDVPLLLAGLDVVCLCSDLECFSLTMLEAAAAGCAFVGPDSGSLDEFLRHEQTGLMTPPADPVALADALERLIVDSALRRRLAENGRKLAWSSFGIDRTAEAFADLFYELRGRRKPAPRVATAVAPETVRSAIGRSPVLAP